MLYSANRKGKEETNRKVVSIGLLFILAFSAVVGFAVAPVKAASTWYVDPLGTDDGSHGTGPGASAFKTITYAISSASDSDTIMVAAATYNEEVDVTKALTIVGAGADSTIIDGTGLTVTDGLVVITAAGDVTFSGFTVRNAYSNATDAYGYHVRVEIYTDSRVAGVTYTISNNKIYGTNNASEAQDYGFYAYGGKENLMFTHNLVTQTGANNILLELHAGSTDISYNTLDAGAYGCDSIFFMTYNGVDVTSLQSACYNTFDMGTGEAFDYDHRATGVSFCSVWPSLGSPPEAKFTSMVVSGNTFNNLREYRRGIGFWIAGTGDDLVSPLVTGNTINGVGKPTGSYGIYFVGDGDTTGATLTGNTITGTEVCIGLRSGDASGTKINYNNIAGNTIGLDWTGGSTADARSNWWGNPSGPNPPGSGDPVTGNADVSGYLHSQFAARLYTGPDPVVKSYADVGTDFTLDVKVEKIEDLFGFDVNLTWDNTLITFQDCYYSSTLDTLWGSLGWGLTLNSNGVNAGMGWYKLVALSTSSGFTTTGSQTVFTLKFHVEKGSNFLLQTPIHFETAKLSNSLTPIPISIPAAVDDGLYQISARETLDLELDVVDPNPSKLFEYCKTFEVEAYATHVTDMTGFDLTIQFNSELLKFVDIDYWGVFGVGLFSSKTGSVHVWNILGASQTGDKVLLFALTFHVEFDQGDEHIWRVGHPQQLTAQVSVENDVGDFTFAEGTIPITGITVPSPLTLTIYLIRGDVNCDGSVGILDLRTIAAYYDQSAPAKYDLTNDGTIDIFDLVVVAKNFGYGET